MARGDSYQLQGQQGGVVLAAGDSASGPFRWVQVLIDTEFDVFESNLESGDTFLTGLILPAGSGIGGNITAIAVSTGLVIAYYA